MTLYRFGRWTLDTATRELAAEGRAEKLGARGFDVLLALLERRGEVVSRDELFERAWHGRAVIDDNLKVQVMALRRLLGADAIVTVAGHGYRFGWPVRRGDEAAVKPSLNAFIGRSAELARLRELLEPGSWVTLTGPGGAGKTRLADAAAAAAAAAARFADGVITVELASLTEAAELPQALAQALRLPSTAADVAALGATMATMSALLVLDNCEHLADAVRTLVEALRAAAPRLAVLATSQVPLGAAAETLLPLAGLDAEGDALALFTARVAARLPDFVLEGPERDAVEALCREFAGLPLAIELAAARVPLLGVRGALARLEAPLALSATATPAPPAPARRQRSLREAIGWSHALLDEPARAFFRHLAVFADSFTIESAQALRQELARVLRHGVVPPTQAEAAPDDGDADPELLELMQQLQARSLLQVLSNGSRLPRLRYRLLPHARSFAREQAQAAGEWAALRQSHLHVVTERFRGADRRFECTPMLDWVDDLQPELPELRAAFATAFEGGEEAWPAAVALAGAAGSLWTHAGLDAEARTVLRRLIPFVERQAARLRGDDLLAFWFAIAKRHVDPSFSWPETFDAITRALALARARGDAPWTYRCLALWAPLGQRLHRPVDFAASADEMRRLEAPDWSAIQRDARRRIEARVRHVAGDWEGVALRERLSHRLMVEAGDLQRAWMAAHSAALADIACGRADAAVALMREVAGQISERGLQRRCWVQMAMFALALIDAEQARDEAMPALMRLMRQVNGYTWMPMHWPDALAQRGRLADAARLLGWADRRCAEREEKPSAHGDRARERLLQRLAQAFDGPRCQALLAEGARLDDDEAAALILAE